MVNGSLIFQSQLAWHQLQSVPPRLPQLMTKIWFDLGFWYVSADVEIQDYWLAA
jgi:hypothetical protein